MVKVLEKAGCEVVYNSNQTCCGQAAFNAGFARECKPVAEKFVKDFEDAEYIVTPSASCGGFINNYYHELITNEEDRKISEKVYEFTDFLCNVVNVVDFGAVFNHHVTYHDSCAALRECNIKQEPRRLLAKVSGLTFTEMNDVETCCGFGGTFAVKFQDISHAMGEQKVNNASETKAEYIISTDLSCLMHIDGVAKNMGNSIKNIHIADVLASGW